MPNSAGLGRERVSPRYSVDSRRATLAAAAAETGLSFRQVRVPVHSARELTTNWKQALAQLTLAYPERIEPYL